MQVGTIVKLKVRCLDNPAGTLGVVFYDYGDGFQAIFENGNYDGFHTVVEPNNPPFWWGKSEADYFLDIRHVEPSLANYQFKNVTQVSEDFRRGLFDIVWKEL